ncbi:MAG: phosphate acyltransferase PlsX [Sedimentisphaerales bacterium]|nr:phosphate acyltransferase PlsX [Sedimentisphaerales bacterium]
MRIAIDAMGGDNAPQEIIAGALESLEYIENDQLVLVGDEPTILSLLGDESRWKHNICVVHAPEIVGMDESPVEAIRRKRNSSISIMVKLAVDGQADAVISAGNTGAFVAACQMRLRVLTGVQRPGILVVFPTFAGPVALCDVGANIAPKPLHLYQYALMSMVYVRAVLGQSHPSVGLISIGQEDAKGNEVVKAANKLLRDDKRIPFVGNVEPRDFLSRPADILICDGFVGNVILKLTEGMAENLFKTIARELEEHKPDIVDHFKPIVDDLYARHDYSEYGGAPLLGVGGTCIICHGSSNARAIKSAILRTRDQLKFDLNQKITENL